jgi:ankyrin repeat protein/tetratricopeptide (TPR) repeat protein
MMDPLSVTVASLSIIGSCTQCALILTQWIGKLKTIDERIQTFINEIQSLSATHDALQKSLQQPAIVAAARNTEQNAGAALWKQVQRSLNDCKDTLEKLQKVLNDINPNSGSLFRRPILTFKESLLSGDMAALRQRLILFNSTLSLPLQMINVTLQLEQQEVTADQNERLDLQISTLNKMTNRLATRLGPYISDVPESSTDEQTLVYEGLESCLEIARKFCSNASVVSSVRSGASTITPVGARSAWTNPGMGSVAGDPLSNERRKRIESWVPIAESNDSESELISGSPGSTGITSVTGISNHRLTRGSIPEADDSVESERTRKLLEMGQGKLDRQDYAGAEKCYQKAISMLEQHDLRHRVALELEEVHIMLASAYLKQQKYDEAEAFLRPLTETGITSESLRTFSACHLLGELYLKKAAVDLLASQSDDMTPLLDLAERYSMTAYNGRRKEMGKGNPLCLESVRLLVQIYRAKDDDVEVEFWEQFLAAESAPARPLSETSVQASHQAEPYSPLIDISNEDDLPSQAERQSKSRFALSFRRKPSNSMSKIQRLETNGLSMPPTTPAESVASAQSYGTSPTSLSPVLQAASLSGQTSRRSGTSLSIASKCKPRSPSKELLPPRPPPEPLAINPTNRSFTREEAATRIFHEIQEHCAKNDHKKAVKKAIEFLSAYSSKAGVPFLFEKEIGKNIREGRKKGLAATGHGYAPLHFFASLPIDCAFEMKLLIKQGVDVNATDSVDPRIFPYRALPLAVEQGNSEVVRTLLDTLDIEIEVRDEFQRTPLIIACDKNDVKLVELLLDRGATMFPKGCFSLFFRVARYGTPDILRLLLKRGIPIPAKAPGDPLPLLIAAVISSQVGLKGDQLIRKVVHRAEVVQLLLDAGADLHVEDDAGRTAMYYAAVENATDVIALLESSGAAVAEAVPA